MYTAVLLKQIGGIPACGNSLLLIVFPVLGYILSQGVVGIWCTQQGLYAAHEQKRHDQPLSEYATTLIGKSCKLCHAPRHILGRRQATYLSSTVRI